MRKRVLVCAVLAWAVTATNASAQVITNMAKRAGIGGSVGAIFTFDDDVNVGTGFGINAGLAPAPGLGPTLGFGCTRVISPCPESPETSKSDVSASGR